MVRRDVGIVRVDGARRKSATLEGAGVRGARRWRARRKSATLEGAGGRGARRWSARRKSASW